MIYEDIYFPLHERTEQELQNSGIALIMVLGLLTVMVLMAVTFAVSMRTERLAAGNAADTVRAREMVQAALARAHARLGHIPSSAAAEIGRKASLKHVKLRRVKAIEDKIHHDLMAMVKALTEVCAGGAGKFVHLGATSYDIEDTALALQLRIMVPVIAFIYYL